MLQGFCASAGAGRAAGPDPDKVAAALAEVERFKQFEKLQKRQRDAIELLQYMREQSRDLQTHVRKQAKRLGLR